MKRWKVLVLVILYLLLLKRVYVQFCHRRKVTGSVCLSAGRSFFLASTRKKSFIKLKFVHILINRLLLCNKPLLGPVGVYCSSLPCLGFLFHFLLMLFGSYLDIERVWTLDRNITKNTVCFYLF